MFLKKTKKKNDTQPMNCEVGELIHFLRTPLSSIKAGAQILKELLPELIEAYEKSATLNVIENKISGVKLGKLDSVLNNILSEAERVSQHVNAIEKNKT